MPSMCWRSTENIFGIFHYRCARPTWTGYSAGDPTAFFVNPFEIGAVGPDLFRAACNMGLEGLVSKHRDRPYRAGRSPHWIKVKNPKSPAMTRAMEVDWSRE